MDNLDEVTEQALIKFASDSKLGEWAEMLSDLIKILKDLGRQKQWTEIITLCVHQPGDLGARLTGDSRCKQEGPISKSLGNSYSRTQIRGWGFDLQQKDSFELFCRVHSTPRNKIQRDQGNNFQLKDAGIPFALSARKAETELTLRPIIKPPYKGTEA